MNSYHFEYPFLSTKGRTPASGAEGAADSMRYRDDLSNCDRIYAAPATLGAVIHE